MQIASRKGALVLKELAIQCGLEKIAVLRFAVEASHFAVVRLQGHEQGVRFATVEQTFTDLASKQIFLARFVRDSV